uniref:Insulin-like domain-containing protein n=1 Tax=Glossina austeni TaxID=7395 RepID=A0A1A9VT27_GLOAU
MKLNLNLCKFVCCGLLVLVLMTEHSMAGQRFCGKALQDVLDSLCLNGFNPMIRSVMHKKSVDLSDYTDNEIEDSLTAYPYDNSLFLDKLFGEDVGHMMTKTRRRRHGVYDECCRKPCNYTELASYCFITKSVFALLLQLIIR